MMLYYLGFFSYFFKMLKYTLSFMSILFSIYCQSSVVSLLSFTFIGRYIYVSSVWKLKTLGLPVSLFWVLFVAESVFLPSGEQIVDWLLGSSWMGYNGFIYLRNIFLFVNLFFLKI